MTNSTKVVHIEEDTSWQVALFSRNTNNGANDSRFYYNLNNTSGNLNSNISSQLSLFQGHTVTQYGTMPLGKTQSNPHWCW